MTSKEELEKAIKNLGEFSGHLDLQTYDIKQKHEWDTPDDMEFDIVISSAMDSKVQRAIATLERLLEEGNFDAV